MKKKIIDKEDVGRIYHYTLRTQTFDQTIEELTKIKLEYQEKGYTDISIWFNCGEDANYISVEARQPEVEEENDI